ncbi:hypothetical protein EIP86_006994 [Pleurotus ostreatoroseus]|nr:hypothetical protein EIP86_006994 [Pleurotus ostreatoroseus]
MNDSETMEQLPPAQAPDHGFLIVVITMVTFLEPGSSAISHNAQAVIVRLWPETYYILVVDSDRRELLRLQIVPTLRVVCDETYGAESSLRFGLDIASTQAWPTLLVPQDRSSDLWEFVEDLVSCRKTVTELRQEQERSLASAMSLIMPHPTTQWRGFDRACA